MDKDKFINQIREGALKGKEEFGILPSLTIAQAILESGWGSSQLAQRANNLFGIKAFSNWQGRTITLPTTEWYKGQKQLINAEFRAYNSFNESILDHNKLLSYKRYKPVRECINYKDACTKIFECGYATDPDYPSKLQSIIEENQLYLLDDNKGYIEAAIDNESDRVLKFQKLCNTLGIKDSAGKALVEDNILGWRTMSCVHNMPVLTVGSRGEAVKFVQSIVGARPVDGIFGSITRGCVLEYQKMKGLFADEIVGDQTWMSFIK